jgi:uracil-DNA glycosylase family 4
MYMKADNGVERWKNLEVFKSYAVQCATDDKPNKAITVQCRHFLNQNLRRIQPKLVVAFGADAMRTMLPGTKNKFDDVRGAFLETTQHTQMHGQASVQPVKLLTTFSPKAVLAQPGLFDEMVRDLRRGFLFVEGREEHTKFSEEELREAYRFPRTVEAVRQLCQEIIDYSNPGEPPDRHLIAVDTETSTLEPYDPTAKIICISFAWAAQKAATIMLDHPRGWWTPEELDQVKYHVCRVLACGKPKVLHNDKFDRQMIVHCYGWPLENVIWDTMGGEHLIEEDKRGVYGLKNLTRSRLPAYAGYDDKVTTMRDEHGGKTRAEEGKRFRKATEKYQQALKEYLPRAEAHEQEFTVYLREVDQWEQRKRKEKERAAAARKAGETDKSLRKMRSDVIGKKPKKPLKPRRPVEPEHQEPFDYTMIPVEDLELYAGIDADVTRQHVLHQNKRLDLEYKRDVAARKKVQNAEPVPRPVKRLMGYHVTPTSKTFASMEFTGFPIDLTYLEDLDAKLEKTVNETERELFEMAGGPFKTSSPQDVNRILFLHGFKDMETGETVTVPITDDMGRTQKGQIQSNEKNLLYIANTYKYAFPKKVIQYRKASKARSPFLTNVREHAVIDGRMHPSFHLNGTSTGRSSSSGENMQNIPKILAGHNIKKIFVPPPGYTLIDTDARGAEIRIFAAYSHDERLIRAINDGLDTHSFFTSEVFGVPYDEVQHMRQVSDDLYALKLEGKPFDQTLLDKANAIVKKRTNCKRVVFGTLYGAAAPKIAETAGISLKEAKEVIAKMFDMFPSIPAYIKRTEMEVRLFKGVYTKCGRKRRFPMSDIRAFSSRCFRQAVNFKIQSTSSDIVLWVLNQIFPIVTQDLKGFFHATVHDSVVFSVPHAYTSQVGDLMHEYGTKRVAQEFPWLPVEFLWDVEAGLNYGECTSIDKYLAGMTHDIQKQEEEVITDQEVRNELEQLAN